MLTAIVLAALGQIDGVFVEIDRNDWLRVVKSPSVKEIVVANIYGVDNEDCVNGCEKFDQAIALIDAAPKNAKIYIGLRYDKNFKVMTADGAEEREVAARFWNRLTDDQKARITGWYIAGEWHNSTEAGYQQKVIDYLDEATDRSKKVKNRLPPGEVVVAPFFVARDQPKSTCKDVLAVDETAKMIKAILAKKKITRLLLQDGFGARNDRDCKWGDDDDGYQKTAQQYVSEVAKVAKKANVEFGIVLEAFGDLGENQRRLDLQFAIVPAGARVIVYEHRACCVTGLCQ